MNGSDTSSLKFSYDGKILASRGGKHDDSMQNVMGKDSANSWGIHVGIVSHVSRGCLYFVSVKDVGNDQITT